MQRTKVWLVVIGAALLLLGCLCPLLIAHLIKAGGSEVHRSELSRVTSPDDQFDAVLISDSYGGSLGGIEWYLYVVRKGQPVPKDTEKAVLWAESLRGESIAWKKPHLVEVRYDRASIVRFRNLWALNSIEDVGAYGQHDYYVELRLAPTSQDFSLLDVDGHFAH
jgi:hypothetical protein